MYITDIFNGKSLDTFPTDIDGFSQFNQAEMLIEIFKVINSTNNYFVEFGARRPAILNSSYFRIYKNWRGLLLDGAPGESPNGGSWNFKDIQELLNNDDDSNCRLRKEFITVENINNIFKKYNVPLTFDLLTIDIDKNDYWIARSILENKQFFPRVVCIEYSSFFNSDEKYVPEYKFDNVWIPPNITGSSLVSFYELFKFYNYSYVGNSAGEHAIFILNSELPSKYQNMYIPYKTASGWQYNERLNCIKNNNLFDKNLSIYIGNSPNVNTKIIKLDKDYYPSTKLYFNHEYQDNFSYSFNKNNLTITRIDIKEGWHQDLIGYLSLDLFETFLNNKTMDKWIHPPSL